MFKFGFKDGITTLCSFSGPDGSQPSSLILGTDGNFYGTTEYGGTHYDATVNDQTGEGTLFQITPAGKLTTLHFFTGSEGANPISLVQGADGAFYGMTIYGGNTDYDPQNVDAYVGSGCTRGFRSNVCQSAASVDADNAWSFLLSRETADVR